MAPNPPLTRPSRTVRRAVKETHLRAVRRVVAASRRIQSRADAVKAEFRRIDPRDPFAGRDVQKRFAALAEDFEREIAETIRVQSGETARQVVRALAATVPKGYAPFPAIRQAGSVAPYQPDGFKVLGLIGGLSAFAFIGIMAYRSGNAAGLATTELAVDRLATRAKRAVQSRGLAASNGSMIVTLESVFRVPVAKRIPVARLIPTAVPIPVAAQTWPPFILDLPPSAPKPVTSLAVIPSKRSEPEFELTPREDRHRGYPGEEYVLPGDPAKPVEPRLPIRTLVGWQILSMLDSRVRPKHAERHGRIYYYNPRPERGERGMDEMPNPPYESAKDGGVMAWNCRCSLAPVFEDQER